MKALSLKTASQQKLEWLGSLRRPLTEEESDELRRALHAVYVYNQRQAARCRALQLHEREERELLAKVEAESRQQDRSEWR